MRNVMTILRRELRSYFNSPIAYIVITVFLLISGWFFSSNLFLMNQATLRAAFGIIPLIFIFFVPAITMRLISEEKKSGTIELLVTMPIKDHQIVLGKFFAALILLAIALAFTLFYALTVSLLGNADGGPMVGGYLGLLLMGAAYLALGMFASALTENQIVAFIVSFLIIFILFMLDKVIFFVPSWMATIFEYVSIDYHFNNIARGVIDTRDIIYYLSVIVLGLTLASRMIERRMWA
jgi:ABC-2 type transport system permease protein